MRLHRYKEFNEGIISKGMELLHHPTIKENDKIAKKYIDMIYKDWEKQKNLLAVFMNFNDGYDTFTYKICENPRAFAGTSGGDHDYIQVNFTSIHQFGWDSDSTRARIDVEFTPVGNRTPGSGRTRKVFGRIRNSGKLISNEKGLSEKEEESIGTYLNISQGPVDKLIEFFKNQFISKYPEMKSDSHFSYLKVLKIDKELSRSLENERIQRSKKEKEDYEKENNRMSKLIEDTALYDREYIRDYFTDLTDMIKEKIETKLHIDIGFVENGELVLQNAMNNLTTGKEFTMYRKDKTQLKDGSVYILDYTMYYNDETDSSFPRSEDFKQIDNEIRKLLKENYGLIKGSKNSIFRLSNIEITDQYTFGAGYVKYKIVLEES